MVPEVLNLYTSSEVYDQAGYALIAGSEIGNIGTGRPGEIRHNMPADPPTYDATVRGPDAEGSIASMGEARKLLIDHDVFDWVDPPDICPTNSVEVSIQMEVQPRRRSVSTQDQGGCARLPRSRYWSRQGSACGYSGTCASTDR